MYLILLWTLFNHATAQVTAAQSLYSQKTFNSLRTCAIGCFEMYYGTWGCCNDILSPQLNCPLPYPNSCFCSADLQPVASSIISKCVSDACSNTIDVDSALSVYGGYCSTAMETIAPTSMKMTSTLSGKVTVITDFASSSAGQSSAGTVGTPTPTSGPQSTSTSTPLGSPIGAIVGGVIGGLLILSVAVVAVVWLIIREMRTLRKQREIKAEAARRHARRVVKQHVATEAIIL